VDAPDNVSLAPTNASTSASLFTRYTGATLATALTGETRKTSKNRRKEERKRARGKKGSVYEEEYLVNSVHRLIERVETTRVDAGCVIDAMVRRGMWNNASVLQAKVRGMVTMIEGCIGEVFVQPPAAPEEVERGGEMRGGFPQPTRRILQVVEMPLIKKFEGLSLL
jgi:elongator complex protein 1